MATIVMYAAIILCALCVGSLAYGLWDLARVINELSKYNQ